MSQLPRPHFIDTDLQPIVDACVARYEELTGRTLYPAQVERLLINLIAYREHLLRVGIQQAAEQNLVAYARAPMLDYLGQLVGVTRLPAQAARCVLRFALAEPADHDILIPVGTAVYSRDGRQCFLVDADATLAAGVLHVEATATARTEGEAANGIAPGHLNTLAGGVVDEAVSVTNLDPTADGAEAESDDHLRERIMLAPEAFSVAGSTLAYRYHVLSAHASIVDVGVISPEPGVVELYPLTGDGLPDAALLALVAATVSGEKVRPLTDQVHVLPPERVVYDLEVVISLFRNADAEVTQAVALAGLTAHAHALRAELGRDVVRSQFVDAAFAPGVYDATVLAPAADIVLARNQWADCANITVTIRGRADE